MDSVAQWLEQLGLRQYASVFAENDVDEEVLSELTDSDLEKLGVTLGHRKKILKAVAALRTDQPATPSGAKFPVSTPPAEAPKAADAERRQLTVMFCDLVGSTELSGRLDPEDLRDVNRAYQDACKAAIERFDGYVARYMGDGVLAYFGYPQAHEDDAERAIHASLGIVESMNGINKRLGREKGVDLAVRVGIATGPVVVGDLIGEGASQESAVVGETPNLAARLQALATPNTVAIGAVTHALARGRFEYQNLGAHELKGIARSVQAWRVIAPTVVESRFDAIHRGELTPLVGREHEIGLLLERWGQAKNGEGQVVLVSGEAGIGKSRITEVLRQRLLTDDAIQLRYQCSPYHTNTAFHPVIEQIERVARIERGDSPEAKLDKLESLLSHAPVDVEVIAPLLAPLLSIPTMGRYAPLELTPGRQKEATLEALGLQIKGLSQRGPVLLIFEDVHWADSTSLEFLDLTVEHARDSRVLVVITYRPEFTHSWSIHTHITSLTLNRFSRNLVADMLEKVTAGKALPEEVRDQIIRKTDGVPLFVEELTKSILESGLLEEEPDRYTLSGPLSDAAIPTTLHDSLMARLDRLKMGRQVAQAGAAIGREFTQELLIPACNFERSELDDALNELVDSALVYRRGSGESTTYIFKHALVQDAAYSSLLLAKRKPLHRRIAETLEIRAPEQPALIAHHWECANDFGKALHFRLKAAQQAAELSAVWEAIAQYWYALTTLERLGETRETQQRNVQILLSLLDIRMHGSAIWRNDGEKERTLWHIDKAIESSTGSDDEMALARLKAFKGDTWSDESLLTQALTHAKTSGDRWVQAEVGEHLSSYLSNRGRFEDSLVHARRAVRIFGELGADVDQGLACVMGARCHAARAGRLEDSLEFARKAREIAERTGDIRLTSRMAMESEPYLYLGLWEETARVAEQGLPVAWEAGNWFVVLFSSAWAAIAYIKLGRRDDAKRLLDKALETADPRVGNDYPRIYLRIALSQLGLANGESERALADARQAVTFTERSIHALDQGAAHRALGEAYKSNDNRHEADAQFHRSLDVLRHTQSRPELAQSLLAHGRFKLEEDADEGNQLLNRALDLFREIEAPGWIDETEAVLSA